MWLTWTTDLICEREGRKTTSNRRNKVKNSKGERPESENREKQRGNRCRIREKGEHEEEEEEEEEERNGECLHTCMRVELPQCLLYSPPGSVPH